MLKCAPYIKTLCSSVLHSGWWREDGTSSLPGSPIRHKVNLPSPTRSENAAAFTSRYDDLNENENPKAIGDECIDYDEIYITAISTQHKNKNGIEGNRHGHVDKEELSQVSQHHDLADVKISSLLPPSPTPKIKTSTAVVSLSSNGEIVTSVIVDQPKTSASNKPNMSPKSETLSIKSDLIHVLKKIRPESPDVTRAAKKLEMARQLGAISKIPKQQHYGACKMNTPPNSPSQR